MNVDTSGRRPDGRQRLHPVDYGDTQWRSLLDFALERAETFECTLPYRVIRLEAADAPLWPPILETYRAEIVDRHASLLRWERLQDVPIEFVRFRLSAPLLRFIRGARHLTDWSWSHGRPEDPAFLVDDVPILLTESEQGRVTVFATRDEKDLLASGGIRLVEPLGVRAEPWPTP